MNDLQQARQVQPKNKVVNGVKIPPHLQYLSKQKLLALMYIFRART
tara:strand:+ start:83 stop:220 length:138 start_codon:yes stop_codon:yes gene_type:complete